MLLRNTCRSQVNSDRHSNARVCGLGRSRALLPRKSFLRAKAIGGDRKGFGDATEDSAGRRADGGLG
jgi:hypothetical protein